MKVRRQADGQLVLTHNRMWVRAMGACLLGGALALILFKSSGQIVDCNSTADGPVCVFSERTLAGTATVERVGANELRKIGVVTETEGDEDSHCVMIATDGDTHQFGRCSIKPEAHLREAVEQLRAFYAGEVPSVRSELSDAPILWLQVALLFMFGLGLIAPGTSRIELDREKGELTLCTRAWLLARAKRERVPLKQIREVSLEVELGEHRDEQQLALRMSDGRRVTLNEPTRKSLAKEHRAIREFLAATASGYR